MASYNLNEELKKRKKSGQAVSENTELALDDVSRVKVLSPGRKVFKRFIRNRLAVFGSVTLIILFVFSFLGPFVYRIGQKETFYKYSTQNVNYALAKVNSTYTGYPVDDEVKVDSKANNAVNTTVKQMEESGADSMSIKGSDDATYVLAKEADSIYSLSAVEQEQVATVGSQDVEVGTYSLIKKTIEYSGNEVEGLEAAAKKNIKGKSGSFKSGDVEYQFEMTKPKTYSIKAHMDGLNYLGEELGKEFETAANAAAETGSSFEVDGKTYTLDGKDGSYVISAQGDASLISMYTCYTINMVDVKNKVTKAFTSAALQAAAADGKFTVDGADYTLVDEDGAMLIKDADGNDYAEMTNFIIRRYSGEDSMAYDLKNAIAQQVARMVSEGSMKSTLTAGIPEQDENGKYIYDEDGNLKTDDTELKITQRNAGEYLINCDQINFVIDMYAAPSAKHPLGTDGDGFDVMSRIMYGGRVSLMVGFVVVFLETFLGVIMGGLAGYYGGWVDNLIMRLVDIFYCLPSMPIMIILGAMMDAMRLGTYIRLLIMMAALGIMGWAGVARLVRGQILGLRDQEFMVATEAVGIKVKSRIFRHLIPNVMPQLIVTATMGMGGVILTESTLSFLGLGVKHPLATWGTIINSVSSAAAMAHYAFIWIPVGLLICLTVIAFNFVGDGLRDAYDPKSRR